MGLKEDIIDDMAKDLANEMDFHIISDVLVNTGWTSVKLNRFNYAETLDINDWLETNCTGKWKNLSTRYVFEKKQDAEWFILRWM